MNINDLVKAVGPILGLIILGLMVWRMFQVEDAGKKITGMIQSRKLIIADLFLVGLAFLEGLVAANMGDDTLGDSYTTRFTSHFVLSMVGAYAGFISIKEIIDFVSKLYEGKYSFIYMFFQALQPVIYFFIAAVMPIFNLIIISKGTESYEILSYLWTTDYSFTEVYGALDDVTARSLLMVLVHILLTGAVALGSIDDVKVEKKDKVKNKDKTLGKKPATDEKGRPNVQASIEIMAEVLGDISSVDITMLMNKAMKAGNPDQWRGRIMNLASKYKGLKSKYDQMVKSDDGNAIENLKEALNKNKSKFKSLLNDLKKA